MTSMFRLRVENFLTALNSKPFREDIATRTFRDQTNPVSSFTPALRNDKS